jgi:alpha-L-fucosidase
VLLNTPTGVPATSTPASQSLVYNDKDPAFRYSRNWSEVIEGQAYMGAFRLTQKVGSSVTLNFTGQTFSIIYKTGPLFGNMDVFVDGTRVHTLNQNTASPLFQQKWSYGGTLSPGTHTLKLVFASPSNGRVSLDAVSIP